MRNETGRSRLRGVVALLLVFLVVYLGMKLIPVRARAFQFSDAVREQGLLANRRIHRPTAGQIRAALMERADDLGLQVEARAISVQLSRSTVYIAVDYSVPIEFAGGFVFEWRFSPSYRGPILR